MKTPQEKILVDYHLLRFFIGMAGITLGILAKIFAEADPTPPLSLQGKDLPSISHSYHYWDLSQNFFVGILCFIGLGFASYRGYPSKILGIKESVLSKIAGSCLIVVAFSPSNIDPTKSAPIHFSAAAVVFVILTLFCICSFRKRAWRKYKENKNSFAKWRAVIYTFCGTVMIVCLIAILLHSRDIIFTSVDTVYWGETIALCAFGVAWLTASKVVAHPDERLKVTDVLF